MRKKLLAVAVMAAIAVSFVAYAWVARDEGAGAEKNQEAPSDVTKFKAVVNGMRSLDVFVCVNISDGLTEQEAELIVGTAFIQVMGDYVTYRLDTLAFDDTQIEAHYTWGHDENDMGHIFDLTADLTTLQITVSHCFSTNVTEFEAVVNGMRSVDVCVCVNISDGLTEQEAELIVGTTFIKVKGDYVTHRLDTLTFDDTQIEAHYTWGHDENDMGHIFDLTADLTTLQITVEHCF